MISEGSCDTEDWRNDAEHLASQGINYILKYIRTENISQIIIKVHSITVFTVFE